MDKAIEIVKECRQMFAGYAPMTHELNSKLDEAITEVEAHKAKIDELKEWCKYGIDKWKYPDELIPRVSIEIYTDILQKLEELDK